MNNLEQAIKDARIYVLEQKWKKDGIYRTGKGEDQKWTMI